MNSQDSRSADCSDEALLTAWKRELSEWLTAVAHTIVFPTGRRRTRPAYPSFAPGNFVLLAERIDLEVDFRLCFVPRAYASRGDWIKWLEALELLGLLATTAGGKRICWGLLIDTTASANKMRSCGWSHHNFHAMRPRFECRFSEVGVPSDEIMSLILSGIPTEEHTANYAQVRSQLIGFAGFRACDQTVELCFHFSFPEQSDGERASAHVDSEECIVEGRDYSGTLCALKRILLLAAQVAAQPPGETSTWMEVVAFGFHMYTVYVADDAREWLRAIASHVPIFWLSYGVSSRADGIGNYYGRFLWRLLAPHPSRRAHLGLQHVSIHSHSVHGSKQIIALCSALAQSQTLRQFSFTDDGGDVSEANSRVWASWLAFALFSRVCCHRIHTVSLNVTDRAALYATSMSQVLHHANPVAYLAAMADGVDTSTAMWPSESVRLQANANIYGSDLPTDSAATTLYHGKGTVECHVAGTSYGKFTRVLIPGVGFGCVRCKDVESTQPALRVSTHPVRSLSLCFKSRDVESIENIFRLVGEPLTTMSVRDTGKWDNSSTVDIGSFLSSCPNAKRVCLDYLVLPLSALTTATWGRELQSLVLRGCRVLPTKSRRRNNLQADSATPLGVFPKLSSLYVSTCTDHHPPELQDFLLALDVERDHDRFVVLSNTATLAKRYIDHANQRDGRVIPGLLLRHKLAFLSVVSSRACEARTRSCELNADTIKHIFELSASPTNNRISISK